MEKYVPDIYQKSIYVIDYQKLWDRGIKCLLFDLDNTLVPADTVRPTKKVKDLFRNLEEMGFKIVIFSNSPKSRLKPFKEELGVDCCASSRKPFKKKFLEVMREYHFAVSEVAIIGDQLLTDIIGGNRIGITTILINPISKTDIIFTKVNRQIEKYIMHRLSKRDLFLQGRYYD